MSDRGDREFLADIREAAHRIASYTVGMAYATFLVDSRTQDAVIRNPEIIGEASKRISEQLRIDHPELPWKGMSRIRDRLIHHYFGVNLDIVWQVATQDLPDVEAHLEAILTS
jgi:uncharacterized protein with HEPN domain